MGSECRGGEGEACNGGWRDLGGGLRHGNAECQVQLKRVRGAAPCSSGA